MSELLRGPRYRIWQNRAGTSAIEFAFVAPLFLMFFFGMTAYGIYFGASHSVQQIAADAARTAIAGLGEAERSALAADFINRNAGGYPFVDPHNIVAHTYGSADDDNQFVVAIRYDARTLPIWNLLDGLPLPGMTITRQSTIRIGGI
ncbi:TadE/TadG family type IV pilus assembly protein [Borborobacter arsenicus]|nr:TadE/TadG family type IV pilus assembly protein [Pseudaminobacter arsenicus]